ncbi:MAG: hypothetical protein IPN14_08280 [Bacteroidetes bacterium]|nr:hypothetical protein [Bacteroidota bacterium]
MMNTIGMKNNFTLNANDETNFYKMFINVKDKDDQIFFFDINEFRILGIADGVSTCSKGRVASATICFALYKYFKEYPITGALSVYVNNAISYAIEELQQVKTLFDEHFDSLFVTTYLPVTPFSKTDGLNESILTSIEEIEPKKEIDEKCISTSPSSINSKQTTELKREKIVRE